MSDQIQKVNLIGINREGIKADSSFPRGHTFFPLRLSTYPDPSGVEIFRHEYGIYFHNKKDSS